jgi:hypothetical protein
MKIFISFIALLFFNNTFSAQNFSIDAQQRNRLEYRDGYRLLASEESNANTLINHRSRLIFNYKDSLIHFRFTPQVGRVWGENWTNMGSNSIHVFESWVQLNLAKGLDLKLGRQVLQYDDHRILASRDWSLTGASYDAALLKYEKSNTKIHLGTMINNKRESLFLELYDFDNSFKYLGFLWAESKIADGLKLNFINVTDMIQKPSAPHVMYGRNTAGLNLIYDRKSYGFRAGGYLQNGNSYVRLNKDRFEKRQLNAYSYNATVWVKPEKNTRLSVNIDVYSGHDWSNEGTDPEMFSGFNRILAGGHRHLGFMDYFASMDLREVNSAGIINPFIRIDRVFSNKFKIQATYHYFMLEKENLPTQDGFEKINRNLGSEIDLIINYPLNKIASLEFALMGMFPGDTMKQLRSSGTGGRQSYFNYIALVINPGLWKK